MARIRLPGLQPDTQYAVQIRTNNGNKWSPWGVRHRFTTISDNFGPKSPTNVVWEPIGTSFVATWNGVTQKTTGDPLLNFKEYEVQVGNGSITETYKVLSPRFELSREMNRTAFGTIQNRLSFRVRANDRAGNSSEWTALVWAEADVPATPVIESITAIQGGIEIRWKPGDDETDISYRIYVDTDNPTFPLPEPHLALWTGVSTSYTYFTMNFVPHHFALTAVNALGLESAPAYATQTPLDPFVLDTEAPPTPTGLTIAPQSPDTVLVSWTHPTDDQTLQGFQIWYKRPQDAEGWADIVGAPADFRSIPVTLKDTQADYYFKIRAYDSSANYSEWSAAVNKSGIPNTAPPVPTGVTTSAGRDTLTVSWDDTNQPDDVKFGGKYEVHIATDTAFTAPLIYEVGSTTLTVAGLDDDTTYYVRIRAVDSLGLTSDWTPYATVTTLLFPLPPGAGDGFAPAVPEAPSTVGGLASITVTWPAVTTRSDGAAQPAGDPVFYEVHASTTSAFTPSTATLVTQAGGTSAVVVRIGGNPITTGTTYYFKIIAKDVDGVSAPSAASAGTQTRKVTSGEVESVTAGQITTGTLSAAGITMGAGGFIQSSNYSAVNKTGYILNETGLTMYNGVVSAGLLSGGTITGTTINIGAGGTLNVDSTAVIKSNNYVSGSTGWRLNSSGLEVNGSAGSISASSIKAGTLSSGTIYVGSGGGIYDINGWWSITPSGINISNGSISASTISSGSFSSNQTVTVNGVTYPAWSINMQGNAVFSNAAIRGAVVVGVYSGTSINNYDSDNGASYIQSGNYSGTTRGWRISSGGEVYFNQAVINGGLFKTQASGSRIEMGRTGVSDPVDEIRMFTGSTVSSIRNPSNWPGSILFSLSTGITMRISPSAEGAGHVIIQGGAQSQGAVVKFLTSGAGVQIRNGYDTSYEDLTCRNLNATSGGSFSSSLSAGSLSSNGNLSVSGSAYFYGGLYLNNNTLYNVGSINNANSLSANTISANYGVSGGSLSSSGSLDVSGLATFRGNVDMPNVPTGSYTANVNMTTGGRIRYNTSSRRFKENIQPVSIDTQTVLSLKPRIFQRNDVLDDTTGLKVPVEYSPWYIGFIAEEANDLGLKHWVTYDSSGLPFGFAYDYWVVAHQAVLQEQDQKIKDLEARLAALENSSA